MGLLEKLRGRGGFSAEAWMKQEHEPGRHWERVFLTGNRKVPGGSVLGL